MPKQDAIPTHLDDTSSLTKEHTLAIPKVVHSWSASKCPGRRSSEPRPRHKATSKATKEFNTRHSDDGSRSISRPFRDARSSAARHRARVSSESVATKT